MTTRRWRSASALACAERACGLASPRPNLRGPRYFDVIATRPTRWAWVPASVVAVTVFALVALLRRSDVAVYRAFGLSRLGVLLMFQVEVAVLTTTVVAAAAVWSICLHVALDPTPDLRHIATAAGTAAMGACAVVGVVRPPQFAERRRPSKRVKVPSQRPMAATLSRRRPSRASSRP